MSFLHVLIPGLLEGSTKRKRILSLDKLEEIQKKKRQEAAARRKRIIEEKNREKEEAEHKNLCLESIVIASDIDILVSTRITSKLKKLSIC